MTDDFLDHKFSVSNYHFGVRGREKKGELRGEQGKVCEERVEELVFCEMG